MMYYFYVDGVLLPVTPGSMKTKINNRNKTVDLASGGEINILKAPGLTEISFECLLPSVEYSFARYENGFKGPDYYLGKFEQLKSQKKAFTFLVIRSISAQTLLQHSARLSVLPESVVQNYDLNGDGRITAADARILLRSQNETTLLDNTNMSCSIEDYTIIEDVEKYGQDIMVSVTLKQCPEYALKTAIYSVSK